MTVLCCAFTVNAAEISGFVWDDVNRSGIQNMGEPGISNALVSLYDHSSNFVEVTSSDNLGNFTFTNVANDTYFLRVIQPQPYYFTIVNVGTDDSLDNDIDEQGHSPLFTFNGVTITNIDAGCFKPVPAMTFKTFAGNAPEGSDLYVTSGTKVVVSCVISNSGETYLSFVGVTQEEDATIIISCPVNLSVGSTVFYTQAVTVTESTTLYLEAFAFPIDFKTCTIISGLDPLFVPGSITVHVTSSASDIDYDGLPDVWESIYGLNPGLSNAPGYNSDADWMTDVEEYWADTVPTNSASYFPLIVLTNPPPGRMSLLVRSASVARIYGVHWSTNLLAAPQNWTLLPPEKTGTGSAINFVITNEAPARFYRTGVRLP